MTTAGSPTRLLRRCVEVGQEILSALPRDFASSGKPSLLHAESGEFARPEATAVALYVHYSHSGRVSEMVLRQLELLAEAGFALVFVSMAPLLATPARTALCQRCALVVQRRNCGYDFGAWRDLLPEIHRRWPELAELLLANDSVLGPIRPLGPVLAALRSREGLFGLTESPQGGPHLQSYFLLLRGKAVLADLAIFLAHLRISHSKWLMVRRAELCLASYLRARGHQVAALFGYQRLLDAVLVDSEALVQLAATYPPLRRLVSLPQHERAALLRCRPLNPTHHLWYPLVHLMGFPFLKTALVRNNPEALRAACGASEMHFSDTCGYPALGEHMTLVGQR